MLILKGKTSKSDVVNRIMQSEDSICFIYSDSKNIIYGDTVFFVDKTMYSLENFLQEIKSVFGNVFYNKQFKYLIIYTNESEENLNSFIHQLEENKNMFQCTEIIVTCNY